MTRGSRPAEVLPGEPVVDQMPDDLLSAVLVHELRQPLFAIKGLVQLLARDHADPRLGEVLDRIRYAEDLLSNVSEHVQSSPGHESFDLSEVMHDVCSMMAPRALEVGVDLEVCSDDRPLSVAGRCTAARQVLINLVQNAIDATTEHGGGLVRVTCGQDGELALCVVEDAGGGIAPGMRESLGRPFVTTKPPGQGTGLGLYISQKLVREHGGTMTFADPQSGGTRVEVRLPLVARS